MNVESEGTKMRLKITDTDTGKLYTAMMNEANRIAVEWDFTTPADNNPQTVWELMGNCILTPSNTPRTANAYKMEEDPQTDKENATETPEAPEAVIVAIDGEKILIYHCENPKRPVANAIHLVHTGKTEYPVSRANKYVSSITRGIAEITGEDGKPQWVEDGQARVIKLIDRHGSKAMIRVTRTVTEFHRILENALSNIFYRNGGRPIAITYGQICREITKQGDEDKIHENELKRIKDGVDYLRFTVASTQKINAKTGITDTFSPTQVIMADARTIRTQDGRTWDGIMLYRAGLFTQFFKDTNTLKSYEDKVLLPSGVKHTLENIVLSNLMGERTIQNKNRLANNKIRYDSIRNREGDPEITVEVEDLFNGVTRERRKGNTPKENAKIRKAIERKNRQMDSIAEAFKKDGVWSTWTHYEENGKRVGIEFTQPPKKKTAQTEEQPTKEPTKE